MDDERLKTTINKNYNQQNMIHSSLCLIICWLLLQVLFIAVFSHSSSVSPLRQFYLLSLSKSGNEMIKNTRSSFGSWDELILHKNATGDDDHSHYVQIGAPGQTHLLDVLSLVWPRAPVCTWTDGSSSQANKVVSAATKATCVPAHKYEGMDVEQPRVPIDCSNMLMSIGTLGCSASMPSYL
jgi:hypothetical protein